MVDSSSVDCTLCDDGLIDLSTADNNDHVYLYVCSVCMIMIMMIVCREGLGAIDLWPPKHYRELEG